MAISIIFIIALYGLSEAMHFTLPYKTRYNMIQKNSGEQLIYDQLKSVTYLLNRTQLVESNNTQNNSETKNIFKISKDSFDPTNSSAVHKNLTKWMPYHLFRNVTFKMHGPNKFNPNQIGSMKISLKN